MPTRSIRANEAANYPSGVGLLSDPGLNKGTAFTEAERETFRPARSLTPRAITQIEQVMRVLENLRRETGAAGQKATKELKGLTAGRAANHPCQGHAQCAVQRMGRRAGQ